VLTKAVEHLPDNGDAAACAVGALATIACRFEALKNLSHHRGEGVADDGDGRMP
jgi:hypothetical protein